jgi:hypothetical protein
MQHFLKHFQPPINQIIILQKIQSDYLSFVDSSDFMFGLFSPTLGST